MVSSTGPQWECRVEPHGAWQPYDKEVADKIEDAYQKNKTTVTFTWGVDSEKPTHDQVTSADGEPEAPPSKKRKKIKHTIVLIPSEHSQLFADMFDVQAKVGAIQAIQVRPHTDFRNPTLTFKWNVREVRRILVSTLHRE